MSQASSWIPAVVMMLAAGMAEAQERPAPADIVLRNGIVYTADARSRVAQAVAITGNRISAVGTNAEIDRFVGPATRTIDVQGQAVIPGFYESHGHLLGVGQQAMNLDLVGTPGWDEVLAKVKTAVAERQPGQWVVGRGWHEGKWADTSSLTVRGFPTHHALSAISPDNPVYLERADGHAAIVNARALELMGITRDTKVPSGGEIIRDGNGEPTGVLVDNAQALVKLPEPTVAEKRRAIELAMKRSLELGVTTFVDAGADTSDLDVYRDHATSAPVRLYVMLEPEAMRALGTPIVDGANGFLTVRAVKLYADGALGSRGAALLEPYLDDAGNSGFYTTTPEQMLDDVRFAFAHGFQPAVHAIGDRAVRMVLDSFETALRERPDARALRPRMEHAQIVDERDIPRFATLGVVASMQGIHATSDRPWAPARLGMDRITEGAYVWRKFLAQGTRVVNGTDAPVEDLSPVRSFHASVTRQDDRGQPPGGFDPDQKMTREQALRSYTSDAAWAAFEEDRKGSLEPGKLADVVVLSKDIMTVPDAEILDAKVVLTIVDGKVWYHRPVTPTSATALDTAAEKYVRLVLAMGEHDADYVDAFYGPAAWREDAKTAKRPLPEIRAEALALAERVKAEPSSADELVTLRRDYLHRQLTALAGRIDVLGGKKMSFDEESQAIYDVVVPPLPDAGFDKVLAEMEGLLPGPGPLVQRYEAFRQKFMVAPEKLAPVFEAALAECRRRSKPWVELPADESFTIEYVRDKSWSAYNWYKGGSRSLIQVNTDLPISIDRAIDLACHEGYPGHHVYNALLEKHLARDRGWVEFTVYPLFSPQSLVAEGTANYGIAVAFPGNEREVFEGDVLFPIAGLDPKEASRWSRVQGLAGQLDYARTEAARRYLDGKLDADGAVAFLQKYALQTEARSRQQLRFFDQYRAYILNYNYGKDLVARWVESRIGPIGTNEQRWQEFQKLLASPRLPGGLTPDR